MHVKAKKAAVGGLMLALTVVFISLGSVIETNTLFLLAAASFFVGIIIREFQMKTGVAFYIAGVLLGLIIAPNKFYVFTYAAMGFYILLREVVWEKLSRLDKINNRKIIFIIAKLIIFNILFALILTFGGELLIGRKMEGGILFTVLVAGQIIFLIYDVAYEYVQCKIWTKLRGKLL